MQPLPDADIERVLVVNAHPDDSDFGASGTIASWVKKGIKVSYVICTNGDQGGESSGISQNEMAKTRQKEQRDAGAVIGVTDITFLNYHDGHLEPTIALRKDLVREIRIHRPDRMVIQSPERNWERIHASHPDHLASGEAAIQAVYPDARNPFAFPDLLKDEKLEPWAVREVWVIGHAEPDHWVDITDLFQLKMQAILSHVSQTAHNDELENMVRAWGERNAAAAGLATGSLAEAFKIVNTD